MFEKIRAAAESRDNAEDRVILNEMLDAIAAMSPEQAQFIPFITLVGYATLDGITEEQKADLIQRNSVILRLNSWPDAPLHPFGYVVSDAGERVRMPHEMFQAALSGEPGTHPLTGEAVENLAAITKLGFALQPEYVAEHAAHYADGAGPRV